MGNYKKNLVPLIGSTFGKSLCNREINFANKLVCQLLIGSPLSFILIIGNHTLRLRLVGFRSK